MRNKKQSSSVTRSRIHRAAIETLESRQLLSGSTPFYAGPQGTNELIPAASYDKGGEGVAYHDTTPTNIGNDPYRSPDAVDMSTGGVTGHIVNNTATGEWLIYTLTIPVAGQYNLVGAVSNTATGALFHPEFNGVYTTGAIAVPNTGSFTKFATVQTTYPATLSAGTCIMRIYVDSVASNGAGGNFDGFNVYPVNLPGPSAEAPYTNAYTIGQTIPAVQFDRGGEGVGYHDTTPSNKGNDPLRQPGGADISYGGTTGDVVGFTAVGEYLNYTINVGTAGKYTLQTSVANPSAGAQFHVEVGGVNLSGAITGKATSSFTTFGNVNSGPINLAQGTQVLRVVFDKAAANGAIGNFDTFKLVPFVSSLEVPFTTPFVSNQVIPAVNYDLGGEGVGYHDTTKTNLGTSSFRSADGVDISTGGTSGNFVAFTAAGEYLNYSLNIATGGMYTLVASVANPVAGAKFHGSIAGVNVTGPITVGATANFTTFATDTSNPFSLAAGPQILKITFDSAASNGALGNYDTFKLVPYVPPGEVPFTTAFGANTVIPAANYDKGGEGIGYHDTTTADQGTAATYRPGDAVDVSTGGTSGHYVGFTAVGEYLRYSLNIATAGMYTLEASTANTAGGGQFHASEGATNLTGAISIGATGSFTTFATETSKAFSLAAGPQILKISLDKAGTNGAVGNFDYFKLVPFVAPTDTPFTSAFATNAVIPAANFDKGGEGISYHDTSANNQGADNYRPGEGVDLQTGGTTGHVVAFTAVGEWLQYTVNVATSGAYQLQASAANPASGASFHLEVNGTNLSGPITIAPTAGFTTYSTNSSSSFQLAAGTQIIRIFLDKAATNGAVGNFDWFKLVPG